MSGKVEEIEFDLLLEAIYQSYGYDFRDYAPASLKRRIRKCMNELDVKTISAFQDKILHETKFFTQLLNTISVDVTSMFRDPDFFLTIREKIFPAIRELPFIRIWHAGCSTGEEIYSMAILLKEEKLYDKARIYATDMNEAVLAKAKNGIFSLKNIKVYISNYHNAGGNADFTEYYTAKYDHAIMKPALKNNVVWAQHNLVTDGSFNEFDIILCRNVMIYFNQPLQEHVHKLFIDSLAVGGVLALGKKESLHLMPCQENYKVIDERVKLFKRVK